MSTGMTVEDAEEYTQSLEQIHSGGWRQIFLAQKLGVPTALGYTSIQDWVRERIGGYVQLALEDRKEAAKELREEGLSTRQIAGVLGVNNATVHRDLNPVANATQEPEAQTQDEPTPVANATQEPEQDCSPLPEEKAAPKEKEPDLDRVRGANVAEASTALVQAQYDTPRRLVTFLEEAPASARRKYIKSFRRLRDWMDQVEKLAVDSNIKEEMFGE